MDLSNAGFQLHWTLQHSRSGNRLTWDRRKTGNLKLVRFETELRCLLLRHRILSREWCDALYLFPHVRRWQIDDTIRTHPKILERLCLRVQAKRNRPPERPKGRDGSKVGRTISVHRGD